jgi:hypothetical protein
MMEVFYSVLSWGSPLGIGLFFFFLGTGAGIFFWGVSHFNKRKSNRSSDE